MKNELIKGSGTREINTKNKDSNSLIKVKVRYRNSAENHKKGIEIFKGVKYREQK